MVLSSAAWQEIRVRSGRDDKFVLKSMISHDNRPFLQQICHPDRSEAKWRDLRLVLRFQWAQNRGPDLMLAKLS